jgi:hypothetical protein
MKKLMVIMGVVLLLTGWGCAKKEKAAIRIGEIQVTAEEFAEAFKASQFAGAGEAARGEFLDTFISRKLILKEAEELGLDKDARFLQSIQLFWEQSLLKLILANKVKELAVTIGVDDREIEDYFQSRKEQDYADKELSEVYEQIKLFLFRQKQARAIQDWVSSLEDKTKIEINYKLLGIEESE